MVRQISASMAVLQPEVVGADLLLSMYIKLLAQTLAAVPALYFTVLPRLNVTDADKQARLELGDMASCNPLDSGCATADSSMTDSTASEEYNPSTCKVQEETLEGPDTSVRLTGKEVNAWLVVCKNKDDDDDDEDEEDEDDEEDDDDDAADDEDAGDDGEGEEDVEGHGGDGGGEDEDDEDDDEENGKEDDEEEDEEGVEGEDDEDEDGVEDEEDEDEEDDDETPEPPQKKRK